MLEIDQYAIPFVLEHLEKLCNVRLFNADVFAVLCEDCLHLFWGEVGNVEHLFDLCLDSDGFADVLEVDGISG